VLVAGSGRSGDVNQLNAEIFSPPYLFHGARPVITSSPAVVPIGTQFFVGTTDAADITAVALGRLGAVTHAVDMEQRYVPLEFQPAVGGLVVRAPASLNISPPGYYMLFVQNTAGVPSVAAFVRVVGAAHATLRRPPPPSRPPPVRSPSPVPPPTMWVSPRSPGSTTGEARAW
jgi:hypothetical protein